MTRRDVAQTIRGRATDALTDMLAAIRAEDRDSTLEALERLREAIADDKAAHGEFELELDS